MNETLRVVLRRVRLEGVGSLRSATGTISDREVIIIEIVDPAGNVGWGECPALARPGYTAEYLDGAWALLRDVLVPWVVDDPTAALDAVDGVPGHPMARSALVGALIDLDLRAAGRSLADALADGEEAARWVPSNAVIGIHETPQALEDAVAASLAAGHDSVKVKIDPAHDRETVGVVRSQWPDLDLSVDANGSYPDAGHAAEALAEVEKIAGRLGYVEQPLRADDLVGTAVLARRIASPVALDESITGVGEATTALSLGAMAVLNLKPARVGGPLQAVAIGRIVAAEGCGVFCGGMVESGVGRAAALAVAAQPVCTLPTDLGPSSRYHRRDLTDPFELVRGGLEVPRAPGIGVQPDRGVLDAVTVETWHR